MSDENASSSPERMLQYILQAGDVIFHDTDVKHLEIVTRNGDVGAIYNNEQIRSLVYDLIYQSNKKRREPFLTRSVEQYSKQFSQPIVPTTDTSPLLPLIVGNYEPNNVAYTDTYQQRRFNIRVGEKKYHPYISKSVALLYPYVSEEGETYLPQKDQTAVLYVVSREEDGEEAEDKAIGKAKDEADGEGKEEDEIKVHLEPAKLLGAFGGYPGDRAKVSGWVFNGVNAEAAAAVAIQVDVNEYVTNLRESGPVQIYSRKGEKSSGRIETKSNKCKLRIDGIDKPIILDLEKWWEWDWFVYPSHTDAHWSGITDPRTPVCFYPLPPSTTKQQLTYWALPRNVHEFLGSGISYWKLEDVGLNEGAMKTDEWLAWRQHKSKQAAEQSAINHVLEMPPPFQREFFQTILQKDLEAWRNKFHPKVKADHIPFVFISSRESGVIALLHMYMDYAKAMKTPTPDAPNVPAPENPLSIRIDQFPQKVHTYKTIDALSKTQGVFDQTLDGSYAVCGASLFRRFYKHWVELGTVKDKRFDFAPLYGHMLHPLVEDLVEVLVPVKKIRAYFAEKTAYDNSEALIKWTRNEGLDTLMSWLSDLMNVFYYAAQKDVTIQHTRELQFSKSHVKTADVDENVEGLLDAQEGVAYARFDEEREAVIELPLDATMFASSKVLIDTLLQHFQMNRDAFSNREKKAIGINIEDTFAGSVNDKVKAYVEKKGANLTKDKIIQKLFPDDKLESHRRQNAIYTVSAVIYIHMVLTTTKEDEAMKFAVSRLSKIGSFLSDTNVATLRKKLDAYVKVTLNGNPSLRRRFENHRKTELADGAVATATRSLSTFRPPMNVDVIKVGDDVGVYLKSLIEHTRDSKPIHRDYHKDPLKKNMCCANAIEDGWDYYSGWKRPELGLVLSGKRSLDLRIHSIHKQQTYKPDGFLASEIRQTDAVILEPDSPDAEPDAPDAPERASEAEEVEALMLWLQRIATDANLSKEPFLQYTKIAVKPEGGAIRNIHMVANDMMAFCNYDLATYLSRLANGYDSSSRVTALRNRATIQNIHNKETIFGIYNKTVQDGLEWSSTEYTREQFVDCLLWLLKSTKVQRAKDDVLLFAASRAILSRILGFISLYHIPDVAIPMMMKKPKNLVSKLLKVMNENRQVMWRKKAHLDVFIRPLETVVSRIGAIIDSNPTKLKSLIETMREDEKTRKLLEMDVLSEEDRIIMVALKQAGITKKLQNAKNVEVEQVNDVGFEQEIPNLEMNMEDAHEQEEINQEEQFDANYRGADPDDVDDEDYNDEYGSMNRED
jgi:hypothetical protein